MASGDESTRVLPGIPPDLQGPAIAGCIVGTAVGDALGLPREGLSSRRARRLFGTLIQHQLLLHRGLVSDDTEHTCLVAQALIASRREPEAFQRDLACRIRRWFWMLPAGVGLATLRACLKLSAGIPPPRSAVFSAGNGPAMRSAVLGLVARDAEHLRALVLASTQITHRDPRAYHAAFAVALAARCAASREDVGPRDYLLRLEALLGAEARELRDVLSRAVESTDKSTPVFAEELGLQNGVSGYALHTAPVCLHAWFRHPHNFRCAVGDVIACGGDADTTGAIIGAIAGAHAGVDGIPVEWVSGIADWPRNVRWMITLGQHLATDDTRIPELSPVLLVLRNVIFLGIVLAHGFRRLLPPY